MILLENSFCDAFASVNLVFGRNTFAELLAARQVSHYEPKCGETVTKGYFSGQIE